MRLAWAFAAGILLGACGVEATPSTAAETGATPSPSPATFPTTTDASRDVPEGIDVPVEAVLDGDSLAVILDGRRVELRLLGINTPERDECHGDISRGITMDLVGETVRLVEVAGADDTDQFGRLLRDVWSGGTWLNGALVERGAAMALHTGAATQAELMDLDEQAWQAGRGMWATDACGDDALPEGLVIASVVADPPGRDEEDLDGEVVVIANQSDNPVDISGWVLRDESTRNRYTFPGGTVLEPGTEIAVTSGCAGHGFCTGIPIWNNAGDTAILLTARGTVVDRYRYTRD